MTATKLGRTMHRRGWFFFSGGKPMRLGGAGGPSVRVSLHALLRYLQRHMFPERGDETTFDDFTSQEDVRAREELAEKIRTARRICEERGTNQVFWQSDDVVIVVLGEREPALVKTVLRPGTVIVDGRHRPVKQ